MHPEGEFKLRQDLARKGVDEETVVWALKEAHLTEEEAESEDERALKLLNQYWRRWEREEPKSRKRKQSSLLARRGFAPSVIWRILKEWEK